MNARINPNEYPFPVYATQGGGYARFVNGILIFVEPPERFPGLYAGSKVPEDWDYQPANRLARALDRDEEQTQGSFNRTC